MNLKIVAHLLKTDWLRLRGWIGAYWLLIVLAAVPALTFSAERFDSPPGPLPNGLDGSIQSQIELLAGNFGVPEWFRIPVQLLSTAGGVILAAGLGFHSRSWTQVRPARRTEAVLAKVSGLLLFLVIPGVLLAGIIPVVQGSDAVGAGKAMVESLHTGFPFAAAGCVFGFLCGGLWRWCAGLLAVAVALMLIPPLLTSRGGIGSLFYFPTPTSLWQTLIALCVLALVTSRHMKPAMRIGSAVLVILGTCLLFPRHFPAVPARPVVEWKGRAEPVLTNLELAGENTADADRWKISFRDKPEPMEKRFDLPLRWETAGLPAGTAVEWRGDGAGEIRSGSQVITRTSGDKGGFSSFTEAKYDKRVLSEAVAPGGKNLSWTSVDYGGVFTDKGRGRSSFFHPVENAGTGSASLSINLEGSVYRYEKVLDVPFGPPTQAEVDGTRIHVRRLDLPGWQPAVDICYVKQVDASEVLDPWSGRHAPSREWLPVLYFPDSGVCRLLDTSMSRSRQALLAPGCLAVRVLHLTQDRMYGKAENPEEQRIDAGTRLLLLKRKDLGRVRSHFESKEMPLVVREETRKLFRGSMFEDTPEFRLRPDPATATAADLNAWLARSYQAFDFEGYQMRDLADFLPRHLDLLLGRSQHVSPPSSTEGEAIIVACPESRRDEVIAALPRRNANPDANWLSHVILSRGWTDAAAPELREIAAQGRIGLNPYTRAAIARLEDPGTYRALLEGEMWTDHYETILRLPGIEPVLEEWFAKRNAEAKRIAPGWGMRDELQVSGLAAANGNTVAFANLMRAWELPAGTDQNDWSYALVDLIRMPKEVRGRAQIVAFMQGKIATDFEYDRLARLWAVRTEISKR